MPAKFARYSPQLGAFYDSADIRNAHVVYSFQMATSRSTGNGMQRYWIDDKSTSVPGGS